MEPDRRILRRTPHIAQAYIAPAIEAEVVGLVAIVSERLGDLDREYYLSDDVGVPGVAVYFLVTTHNPPGEVKHWIIKGHKVWPITQRPTSRFHPYAYDRVCAYDRAWELCCYDDEVMMQEEFDAAKKAIKAWTQEA